MLNVPVEHGPSSSPSEPFTAQRTKPLEASWRGRLVLLPCGNTSGFQEWAVSGANPLQLQRMIPPDHWQKTALLLAVFCTAWSTATMTVISLI